jgi:hypothetical protein
MWTWAPEGNAYPGSYLEYVQKLGHEAAWDLFVGFAGTLVRRLEELK